MSPSLIKFIIPNSDINKNIITGWKPPEFTGLDNSLIIVPYYYKKTMSLLSKLITII